ncbi:protein cholesin isoform X2 [Castor canadensis]
MAKQKRKGDRENELAEKKSKKQKKAEERSRAPEAMQDGEEGGPEGAAVSKMQDAGPELSPEERRVLERKLKKERKKEEKKRLQEAGVTVAQAPPARRSGAELALDYLCGWAQKHASWRFQKTRQTWLLLHMYDRDKVPDEHFSTLLAYLEGLKGRARELTVQKAEALMQELDAAGVDAAPVGKAGRLRQVLQLLSCSPGDGGGHCRQRAALSLSTH